MAKKPKQVEYTDPNGQTQTGWYSDGHVYQDEAATQPLPEGSTFRANSGKVYEMTRYGGVLLSSPTQEDANGAWIPQGNRWYREAADLTGELAGRAPFSYDPGEDPLYQSAREQAELSGSRAMQDAMGRAAALTGGYGTSYAQAAGQQAYALELQKLSELLPELYDRARDGYDAETERLLKQLGELTGLYDRDYRSYLDKLSAQNAERALDQSLQSAAQEQERYEREQELARQKLEQEQQRLDREAALSQQKLAQEREDKLSEQQKQARESAFAQAMQGLTLGVEVPAALLAEAGIDPDYAERLRRYYAARQS